MGRQAWLLRAGGPIAPWVVGAAATAAITAVASRAASLSASLPLLPPAAGTGAGHIGAGHILARSPCRVPSRRAWPQGGSSRPTPEMASLHCGPPNSALLQPRATMRPYSCEDPKRGRSPSQAAPAVLCFGVHSRSRARYKLNRGDCPAVLGGSHASQAQKPQPSPWTFVTATAWPPARPPRLLPRDEAPPSGAGCLAPRPRMWRSAWPAHHNVRELVKIGQPALGTSLGLAARLSRCSKAAARLTAAPVRCTVRRTPAHKRAGQ
jgi:hypothetical protein